MKKIKPVSVIALSLNLVLLAALVITVLKTSNLQREIQILEDENKVITQQKEELIDEKNNYAQAGENDLSVMGETEQDLENWILNMKGLAQKHQVNAYFLQELFPDKIVYNFREEIIYADIDESLPMHNYDWDNLVKDEKGVLSYENGENIESIFGIDVSKYQGNINWEKVKDAGVEFVFIRAGFRGYESGDLVMDEYFKQYLSGATEAGIPAGVYFFSQAVTEEEAVEEAEFILDAIQGYNVAYPVVFDMEEVDAEDYRTKNLTAKAATDISIAFCDRVEQGGYKPMIYGNVSWFLSMQEMHRIKEYDKWFAQYNRHMPFFPYEFEIWQYTHKGRIDGIEGDVDLNICFKDYSLQQ